MDQVSSTVVPAPPAKWRGRWRNLVRRSGVVLVVALILLSPWEWSLFRAMTAPGGDSEQARVAEWVRGQGGGGLVTWAENLQYRLHPAKVGGAPRSDSPLLLQPTPGGATPAAAATPAASAMSVTAGSAPPSPSRRTVPTPATVAPTTTRPHPPPFPDVLPIATPALPREGRWQTLASVAGQPAMRVAYLRPDNVHTSYTSAVVWMNQQLLRTVYHPGTDQPGGGPWELPADLAGPRRVGLLAAYNSAFRLGDAKGGFYNEGKMVAPLRAGAASMVTTLDGRVQVGSWGTDVTMTPQVASVRQNLILLVDKSAVVPSINDNSGERWGQTISHRAFVWRTGVGVTASGDVVFAAGNGLSQATLAELLRRAGAQRAMELDINPAWTTFITYGQSAGPGTDERLLLPDMVKRANRYDTSSTRDFYAVYVKP